MAVSIYHGAYLEVWGTCPALCIAMRYACVVMLAGGDVTENADVVERAHGGI